MRTGARLVGWLALGAVVSTLTAVACGPAADEVTPGDGGPADGGACDLKKVVRFQTAPCDTCMQERCCGSTAACFAKAEDPAGECATLHACIVRCPELVQQFFIPIGGGPPDEDAAILAAPDAGPTCKSDCQAAHPAAAARQQAYDDCIRTQCASACVTE